MKRIATIFFPLLVCICFVSCCSKENDIVGKGGSTDSIPQITVPFLVFTENDAGDNLEARKFYWDISNGVIIDKKELVYTHQSGDYILPRFWDGNTYILYDGASVAPEYSDVVSFDSDYNTYGKNIKMSAVFDDEGTFMGHEITIYSGCDYETFISDRFYKVEGERVIGKTPTYISYDADTDEIMVLSIDYNGTLNRIFVFVGGKDEDSEVALTEIRVSDSIECGGNALPLTNNSVFSENVLYFQSIESIAYCDIKQKTSGILEELVNQCRGVVKEGSFQPDYEAFITPIGAYDGIVILNVPVTTDTDIESLMCAVFENRVIGSLHMKKDGIWNVRTYGRDIISVFDTTEMTFYPFYDGTAIFPNGGV